MQGELSLGACKDLGSALGGARGISSPLPSWALLHFTAVSSPINLKRRITIILVILHALSSAKSWNNCLFFNQVAVICFPNTYCESTIKSATVPLNPTSGILFPFAAVLPLVPPRYSPPERAGYAFPGSTPLATCSSSTHRSSWNSYETIIIWVTAWKVSKSEVSI